MSTITDSADLQATPAPRTIARIAVGVDGHPEGNDAVVLGAMIADATHAELMLVAVHPDPLVVLPEEMNWKSLERQAASMLREIRDSFAPDARIDVEPTFPFRARLSASSDASIAICSWWAPADTARRDGCGSANGPASCCATSNAPSRSPREVCTASRRTS